MKKSTVQAILIIIACLLFCFANSCNDENKPVKQTVSLEYFKQGQILLPDYACTDTLVVIDADGLNKAFAPIEQGIAGDNFGDMQYDSLFHVYCEDYTGSFQDQFNKLKALEPTWDSLQIATAINED